MLISSLSQINYSIQRTLGLTLLFVILVYNLEIMQEKYLFLFTAKNYLTFHVIYSAFLLSNSDEITYCIIVIISKNENKRTIKM